MWMRTFGLQLSNPETQKNQTLPWQWKLIYYKWDIKCERIQNKWLHKADKGAQLRINVAAVCSNLVFCGVGNVSLNPLCQYSTCRIVRKICAPIPCIFRSVQCRGSGACMCQIIGSISVPRKNNFHIEEALSTRRTEGVMAFCDFLVSQLGLLLWCADTAAISQRSWTQELREK